MKRSCTSPYKHWMARAVVIDDPRPSIACTEVEKTQFKKKIYIYKNIGTELKIGTDGDVNLFINFKWP